MITAEQAKKNGEAVRNANRKKSIEIAIEDFKKYKPFFDALIISESERGEFSCDYLFNEKPSHEFFLLVSSEYSKLGYDVSEFFESDYRYFFSWLDA